MAVRTSIDVLADVLLLLARPLARLPASELVLVGDTDARDGHYGAVAAALSPNIGDELQRVFVEPAALLAASASDAPPDNATLAVGHLLTVVRESSASTLNVADLFMSWAALQYPGVAVGAVLHGSTTPATPADQQRVDEFLQALLQMQHHGWLGVIRSTASCDLVTKRM